jgi:hypothetical protein
MKTSSFDEYLTKRFEKKQINEIENQARIEKDFLQSLQEEISTAVAGCKKTKR